MDAEITEMTMIAEKRCRKVYKGNYKFSPHVKHCVEKEQAIWALIRYRHNGDGNRGSIS